MRALLDTHSFLWAVGEDDQLTPAARELITDGDNEIFLSVVSAWEISIKYSKKRLTLVSPPGVYVPDRLRLFGIQQLPVTLGHATQVAELPFHHRDPFDRILIAQAQLEGMPIITSDRNIASYDIEVIW